MSSLNERWQDVNVKYLISAKVLYFTLNLEMYAFYLYRPIFVTHYLGVSLKNYGTIASVMACVSFPFMTIWGTVADALGRPKAVLTVLALCTAASFELMLIKLEKGTLKQFVYVLGVMTAYAAFCAGMQPLLDVIALKILTVNPAFSKEMYGRQRLWGTIAYAIVNLVTAFLMDRIGQDALFVIVPAAALLFAAMLLLSAPADAPRTIRSLLAERRQKKEEEQAVRAQQDTPSRRHPLLVLLTNPGYLFFLMAVFMTGLARATMTNFLALFWKRSMGLSTQQIAIGATSGVLLEVGIFFYGSYFSNLLSNQWMLLIAQAAMALRSWLYWAMPDSARWYPAVLGVELLKGVAFGFTHLAGVKTAAAAAPPDLQATSQSIYNSIYAQLPAVIAAFVGARLYEPIGPHTLFLIVAIISSVSMAAFALKYVADGSIGVGRRKQPAIVVNDHDAEMSSRSSGAAVAADRVVNELPLRDLESFDKKL